MAIFTLLIVPRDEFNVDVIVEAPEAEIDTGTFVGEIEAQAIIPVVKLYEPL